METICYGCMRVKHREGPCEHCGFSEDTSNLPHQLPVGSLLENQYVIGRCLGQGGFGITYIGWDENLSRRVAIKEYFPTGLVARDVTKSYTVRCVAEPELFTKGRERFLKEAKALARLQDMGEIAKVYSYFVSNGTAYIVMEYVDGVELREYIRKQGGKLKPEEAFRTLKPLMEALIKIHKAGIIHRDISPDNIMVKPNGRVVLLDFGTVRDVDRDKNPTQTILKPGFAPMEQYQTEGNMGPWTDEYALCATVYYCLTGKMPPEAPARLMDKVGVDWDSIPGLTHRESTILKKGMALEAEERYTSVEALYADLYKKEPEQVKGGKGPVVLAAVIAIAALAAAGFLTVKYLLPGQETALGAEETTAATQPADRQEAAPGPEILNVIGGENAARGTLMSDWVQLEDAERDGPFAKVFGSEYQRREIHTITFLDELSHVPGGSWDVSADKNGKVMAWVAETDAQPAPIEDEGDEGKTVAPPSQLYDLYIAADGGMDAPEDCTRLFLGYSNLRQIHFNGHFHTQNAADMSEMFWLCYSLEHLDLTDFSTAKVTSMRSMFSGCRSLQDVDLSTVDTSKVTDMGWMFSNCRTVKTLDVSNFDTASVTRMRAMFQSCRSLTELNLEAFDTRKVTDMSWMYNQCHSLETLTWGENYSTAKVKTMERMFGSCGNIRTLPTENLKTTNVTDMQYMFGFCKMLDSVDLASFNTSKVENMTGMFQSCESLEQLSLANLNTTNVTSMRQMFYGCTSLSSLEFGEFHTISVTDMAGMFENCSNLTSLDISGFKTQNVTDMSNMFHMCANLQTLTVGGLDTQKTANMSGMFKGCKKLQSLDLASLCTENVTDMTGMFDECYSLKKLNVDHFATGQVELMDRMFAGCAELPPLDLSSWDVSRVISYVDFMEPGKQVKLKLGKKLTLEPWERLFEKAE